MRIQNTSGSTVLELPGPPMRPVRGSFLSCLVRKFTVKEKPFPPNTLPALLMWVICVSCSGELQRKIGLKVLEMGGNAVVGYLQCFDLEGESGLVVRAIGTACTLDKLSSGSAPSTNTHVHPNTAPASNACNSPSKEGKE